MPSTTESSNVHLHVKIPVLHCKSQDRQPSCKLDDGRNRACHHDTRNCRFRNTTVLVVSALVTLLLVQYNNSSYTLSFVRTIVSINSVDIFQRQISMEVPGANINVSTANEENAATKLPVELRRRVLIAQYTASIPSDSSSSNIYDQFLSVTSKINAAYAVKWKHDFWIMRGIAFRDPNVTAVPPNDYYTVEKCVVDGHQYSLCNIDRFNNITTMDQYVSKNDDVPQSRSTYNKVAILELALMETEYDGLLLLDADAMMYDFSRDIASLLSPNAVLVAHKTNNSEGSHTGSINVGVTLWNLRHVLTPYVAQRWKSHCIRRIMYHSNDKLDDDQAPLQFLLKYELDQNRRDKVVYAIENEFYYGRGTFIRHFIRPAGSAWMNHTIYSESVRLMKIQRSADEVCTNFSLPCDN